MAPNAGDRTRAYRLRAKLRKGEAIDPADQLWLAEYEERQQNGGDIGASATERIINIEERAAAVGTGSAAEAAAAAAMAREEGRRIDYLTKAGMEALIHACNLYKSMTEGLLQRTMALEEVHLSMLDSVREQYLARTQAEIEAMQKDEEGGTGEAMIAAMLQKMTGQNAAAPTLTSKHRNRRGAKSR